MILCMISLMNCYICSNYIFICEIILKLVSDKLSMQMQVATSQTFYNGDHTPQFQTTNGAGIRHIVRQSALLGIQ